MGGRAVHRIISQCLCDALTLVMGCGLAEVKLFRYTLINNCQDQI